MSNYYEITGKINGETEVLFGSFDKSDCTYELDIERDSLRGDGYKCLKITCRKLDDDLSPRDRLLYEMAKRLDAVSEALKAELGGEFTGNWDAYRKSVANDLRELVDHLSTDKALPMYDYDRKGWLQKASLSR